MHVVINYTNVLRLYRILFIILICLCIHYADRFCINLDNWNIFQQHNWHNYAWFFCFHDDNENEAVEAHIPRHRDSKTKKPRHRDSKAEKPRHRDSKTKKPRHRVSAEFWLGASVTWPKVWSGKRVKNKSYDKKINVDQPTVLKLIGVKTCCCFKGPAATIGSIVILLTKQHQMKVAVTVL